MARNHIERLAAFREILLATRREGIRNVLHTRDAMQASGFQIGDSDGSSYGPELKGLQEQIEAVDRAIEDERRLAIAFPGETTSAPPRARSALGTGSSRRRSA
jgi:hypothetical protein